MQAKRSFSPKLFHIGIVCLLLWQIPSPQRSLGHSLFKQKFSQKFLCFLCFVFCVVFVFYFIKISKFALPGVMFMYERTSIDRKKVKKKENVLQNAPSGSILQYFRPSISYKLSIRPLFYIIFTVLHPTLMFTLLFCSILVVGIIFNQTLNNVESVKQ